MCGGIPGVYSDSDDFFTPDVIYSVRSWDRKCVFWFPTHEVEVRGVTVILDKATRDFSTHFYTLHAAPLEEDHCDAIEFTQLWV